MKAGIFALATLSAMLACGGAAAADKNLKNVSRQQQPERMSVPSTSGGMPRTAQVLFAVVNADGTRARGFPSGTGYSASKSGAGVYTVKFGPAGSRNISGCTYLATIGLAGVEGVSPIGFVTVVRRADDPTAVFVQTFDGSGNSADRGFHIAVMC
jgi:hypothetical protein